jgi:hypothetical protein
MWHAVLGSKLFDPEFRAVRKNEAFRNMKRPPVRSDNDRQGTQHKLLLMRDERHLATTVRAAEFGASKRVATRIRITIRP